MATINIKNEVIVNGKSPLNIDNLRNTYIIKDLNFIFKSPFFAYFENQRDYLISKSEVVEMIPRYYQRPEYLSYDKYGTVVLSPLILFINNCYSRIEFKDPEVVVPYLSAIRNVITSAYEFFGNKIETTSIELIKTELLA